MMPPPAMQIIPFQVSPFAYSMVVVLSEESLERIKVQDPAEVITAMFGAPWTGLRVCDVIITYATREDQPTIDDLVARKDVSALLKFLTRGYAFKPDTGDGGAYVATHKAMS